MATTPDPGRQLVPRPGPAAGRHDLSGQFCPNCGAPLSVDEGPSCRFCGEQLMPYFAPQVARAARTGTARGLLFAGLGCLGLAALGVVALVMLFIVALVRQGGSNENGYSCSPGPCASPSGANLDIKKISFGVIPGMPGGDDAGGRAYARIVATEDVPGAADLTVSRADFGLVGVDGTRAPVVTGFSACPLWPDLTIQGYGAAIPPICFAVHGTDITRYRMTWSHLKPGQHISLYMPH